MYNRNGVFSVGVSYTRQDEQGNLSRITEFFIVSAVSFTDCEAKIVEDMVKRTKGEFIVKSIRRMNYEYVLTNEEGGTFYHATVSYKVEQETGKYKKFKINFLVESLEIDKVNQIIKDVLKDSIEDYEVTKVVVSPIMHVIE